MAFGKQAELQTLAVSGKGRRLAAPDVPWELIEQQHKGQGCLWFLMPVLAVSVDRLLHRGTEPAADDAVHPRICLKPLDRTALLKPEVQHRVGLNRGVGGQSELRRRAAGTPAECCPRPSVAQAAGPPPPPCG